MVRIKSRTPQYTLQEVLDFLNETTHTEVIDFINQAEDLLVSAGFYRNELPTVSDVFYEDEDGYHITELWSDWEWPNDTPETEVEVPEEDTVPFLEPVEEVEPIAEVVIEEPVAEPVAEPVSEVVIEEPVAEPEPVVDSATEPIIEPEEVVAREFVPEVLEDIEEPEPEIRKLTFDDFPPILVPCPFCRQVMIQLPARLCPNCHRENI